MRKVALKVLADHTSLKEGRSYDVASVRIQAVDENGNVLHFYNDPVQLEVQGEGMLIGPSVISLHGGMGGTYVKTTQTAGNIRLIVSGERTETVCVEFKVESEGGQEV